LSNQTRDIGTLAYFKTRLGRVAVTSEPKKAVDACIDFFETVVTGHWIACACEILGISSPDQEITLPVHLKRATPREKLLFIENIARKVADRLTVVDSVFNAEDTLATPDDDKVFNYTRTLCHFASLMIEFRDAWAEGDGDRVMRCWKIFLPHFITDGRTKYALEALRLQFQVNVLLSPNLAHQVKWHRFVNTKGGYGHNIPCDLYNEHVNRWVKIIIRNMGSNVTEGALQRSIRCVAPLRDFCEQFDRESNVPVTTTAHSTKSSDEDLKLVVSVALRKKLLSHQGERAHQSFLEIPPNPLIKWNREKTIAWVIKKKREYKKFKGLL